MPYWNRSDGTDHILPFTGDDGATWLRGRLPSLAHALFLTHYGAQCNDARLRDTKKGHGLHRCVTAQIGFRPHRAGHDLVVPPLHRPHAVLPTSLWLSPAITRADPAEAARAALAIGGEGPQARPHTQQVAAQAAQAAPAAQPAAAPAPQPAARGQPSPQAVGPSLLEDTAAADALGALAGSRQYSYLLYFVGKVNRSKREGDIYSGGVRQRIFDSHAHRPDFYVRHRPGAKGGQQDAAARAASKFCLAPYGTGFGMREFDALVHGRSPHRPVPGATCATGTRWC